jgi:trigger factor
MVESAIDFLLESALRNLARSGVDPRMLNLDLEHLRGEMRERAVKEVKSSLLLEALARQENLSVSDAELDERLEKLAKDSGQPLAQVKKRYRDREARESLSIRVREEKSVEFLKAHAKYS